MSIEFCKFFCEFKKIYSVFSFAKMICINFLLYLTKVCVWTILKIIEQINLRVQVEEEKKELKTENVGQKGLPPRPMPPRPPLMRKQIVVEGDVAKTQEPQKVVEEQKPKVEEKIPEQKSEPQKKECAEDDKTFLKHAENHQEKAKKQKIVSDEKRVNQRAGKGFDKKKFWIIFSCVLLGIGLIVGLVFLIISYLPAKPLKAPSNIMIAQSNEIVYVVCDPVEGATKYIFEIDGKKYDSKMPSLDLSNFSEPKQYSIRVYAYGEKKGSLSSASKSITYDLRKVLQAPIIYFNESGSSVISWAEIPNATSYELQFNNQTKELGNNLSFDLSSLGGGAYGVQVRAKTTKSGWVESEYSNLLDCEVYEKLQSPSGKILNDGKIEIDKIDNAVRYNITINSRTFGVTQFDEPKMIIDLSDAGFEESVVITYFKIEAIGEGYFVSNSAELDVTN